MALLEADPLSAPLEEAEVTARPCPPLVVFGQAQTGFVKNAVYIFFGNTSVLERVHGDNAVLVGYVAIAVFVSPNCYVCVHCAAREVPIQPLLERLELQHGGAPAHAC